MKELLKQRIDAILEDMIDELLGVTTDVEINELTGQYPADILDDPAEKKVIFTESIEVSDQLYFKVLDTSTQEFKLGRALSLLESRLVRIPIDGRNILVPSFKLVDIILQNASNRRLVKVGGSEAFYVRVRKKLLLDCAVKL